MPKKVSNINARPETEPTEETNRGRASEQASAMAHRGLDSVRDTAQQLRDKAYRASDDTVNYVKDEPLKAFVIAVAAGAVLIALFSLFSRASARR